MIAPNIQAQKKSGELKKPITIGITTNGPMPTISIMLIAEAWMSVIFRFTSGEDNTENNLIGYPAAIKILIMYAVALSIQFLAGRLELSRTFIAHLSLT